jgi:lysophospholipase L1-like esterase
LLFAGESGNANWVDRVGGVVTMTKAGTLTVNSINQAFNPRWRPEDYPGDTAPLALTPLPTPTIRLDGDSRVVGGFSQNTVGFRQIVRDLLDLDPDISGATLIGSQGAGTIVHYGINGKDSSTFMSEAPGILSVNGTYPANIIVLFIGTNGMTSEVLFDREVTEWETLMFSYKRDIANVRFVIVEETEHDDANRRARSEDLMDRRCRITIPTLIEKGYPIIYVNMWRYVKMMDGDFIDVVHPNDQGNGKIGPRIFDAIKLAAGYAI